MEFISSYERYKNENVGKQDTNSKKQMREDKNICEEKIVVAVHVIIRVNKN